jgi:hypothetical protein
MGHNGCYHPFARAIENNFLGPISGENPTNGITNSTNFPPFMRNQLDRLCSLFNLTNPTVRKPPHTLPQLRPMQEEIRIMVVWYDSKRIPESKFYSY